MGQKDELKVRVPQTWPIRKTQASQVPSRGGCAPAQDSAVKAREENPPWF